jgi:hypothetical protein
LCSFGLCVAAGGGAVNPELPSISDLLSLFMLLPYRAEQEEEIQRGAFNSSLMDGAPRAANVGPRLPRLTLAKSDFCV